MRLVFHCGHPKTGTTYLQNFLALNKEELSQQGFVYPTNFTAFGGRDALKDAEHQLTTAGNAAFLFHCINKKEYEIAGQIIDAIIHSKPANVILSSELFFYYKHATKWVSDRFNDSGYIVDFVSYLPPVIDGLVSSYLQGIRNHGLSVSLGKWLSDPNQTYKVYEYIEFLSSIGNDNFVKPYSLREKSEGVEKSFIKEIGVRLKSPKRPKERLNVTYAVATWEAFRIANTLGVSEEFREWAKKSCNGALPTEREELMRHYSSQVPKSWYGDAVEQLEKLVLNGYLREEHCAALSKATPEESVFRAVDLEEVSEKFTRFAESLRK